MKMKRDNIKYLMRSCHKICNDITLKEKLRCEQINDQTEDPTQQHKSEYKSGCESEYKGKYKSDARASAHVHISYFI